MPYLICPCCRLEAYSAAGYATVDRCSRCGTALGGAERADVLRRRWKVTDVRLTVPQEEVAHGVG